ncbi:MAG: energy transducer TonB [Ignavibacterium sp.]|nr:energy transducer TonB [Ignavibacterium sp.]MDW8376208.1 energy transducer TonB [Ignavibacteriales bacterium]
MDYKQNEFIELSFGNSGQTGSSGAIGDLLNKTEENAKPVEELLQQNKNQEIKDIDLAKAKSFDETNTILPSEKAKENKKEKGSEKNIKENSNLNTKGQGNLTDGKGSLGFDIDWGGMGTRKIYSYILPEYPEGVQKEIDIKLRFSIKPDGTVGSVTLLTKADTRLEQAAINSLWQWRFEPLPQNAKQVNQTAIIVFPYRLN